MRQAGSLAAAGTYALKNNVERLAIDIEKVLSGKSFIKELFPVETNIVIAECVAGFNLNEFILKMKEMGILFFAISPNKFRMVTHLDISNQMQEKLLETIHNIN